MVPTHPWEALPPEVAKVLRPELPALADEIVAELSHGVPDYARPLEGPFGNALRSGVEEALGRFTTMVENPGADRDEGREVYLNLGRGEMRAGRSMDALLAAYRLGARVAWRRLAAAGERAGLHPHTLYALAEAIFAYIDELSADSIEGYAREQAAAAGALQRRRQRLAALLIQEPPATPAAVEAAAVNAAWRLPRSLAALVVEAEGSGEQADRLALRLGPEVLVVQVAPLIVALVPAGGRRRELELAVRGRRAALGPTVTWQEAGVSFARARELLRLAGDGAIEDSGGLLLAETPQAVAAARGGSAPGPRRGRQRPRAARGRDRALARAARLHARRLAAPPRPHRGGREGAARASADRALPPGPAARAVRAAPRRPGRPLRTGAGPPRASTGGLTPELGSSRMAGPLEGRVAAVTGASSGIGEATARALSAAGASVALGARRTDRLEALAESLDGRTLVHEVDVSDEEQARAFIQAANDELGGLHILVNNAGVMLLGPVADADTGEWRQMIEVNLLGLLYCTHAALPLLARGGGGDVVNVSSVAGRHANAGAAVYNMTKFGVHAFSEALRQEALHQGIRVTTVAPGFVETELQGHNTNPLVRQATARAREQIGEVLKADDIADAILHAVTRPAHVCVNEVVVRPTRQAR